MSNKNKEILQRLLQIFMDKRVYQAEKLSKLLGISEKTVRLKIEGLNQWLMDENLGQIMKKPSVGNWLEASDQQFSRLNSLFSKSKDSASEYFSDDDSRIKKIIELLIQHSSSSDITTQMIADEIYYSIPTTLKLIKHAKDWFKLFDIELINQRNKGYQLIGDEIAIRLAMKHYVSIHYEIDEYKQVIHSILKDFDFEKVDESIIKCEKEWNVSFTSQSFMDIYLYVCIAIFRNIRGLSTELVISRSDKETLARYTEYSFSISVFEKISKVYNLTFDENEVYFLTIQILCSNYIDSKCVFQSIDKTVKIFDQKLEEFVERIIDVISSVSNINLRNDEMLKVGLIFHLRPTIFRLKFEKRNDSKMVKQFKEQYLQTFRITWILSALFDEYYDLQVNEEELIYISMYIQAAIERNRPSISLLLISNLSMSINHLIENQLRNILQKNVSIETIGIHEYNLKNYDNVDVILATSQFENDIEKSTVKKYSFIHDRRTLFIEQNLSDQYYFSLKNRILEITSHRYDKDAKFDTVCHTLFDPDLIFPKLDVKSKEELIKHLTEELLVKGFTNNKFKKSVLNRESITSTAIGNGVAIPHGDQDFINESKVVIATLKHPIEWNDSDKVDFVFLLAVKMNSDIEITKTKKFYEQYVKVLENETWMHFLRSAHSAIEIYKFFVK